MRTNGYIQVLQSFGGEVNQYGEPIPTEEMWTEEIPCLIKTNSDTRKGAYVDGEYRHASFEIHVELLQWGSVKRIKLSRYDEDLGEYDVISIEPVPSMGRINIIV